LKYLLPSIKIPKMNIKVIKYFIIISTKSSF
jgi:hypothetical protein